MGRLSKQEWVRKWKRGRGEESTKTKDYEKPYICIILGELS